MQQVFVCGGNVITSLGFSTEEHIDKIKLGISGIRLIQDNSLYPEDFYASLVDNQRLENECAALSCPTQFTRFEKLMILSAQNALAQNQHINPASEKTVFVISSTKGNINLLEENQKAAYEPERIFLWKSAKIIARYFGNNNKPLIISNACISGVLAITAASQLLRSGLYENAVVIGGDIASEFVISGFISFKSLANGICKPFDKNRNGLNLGEGAGTLILSTKPITHHNRPLIKILGGASNNDANHISGPSRTGEGLFLAVSRAMKSSGIKPAQIDFISAHGTATPFNDEMESKAFSSAGLSMAPLNSLKAYFGHTLGAAGIIESCISIYGLSHDIMFKTLGFNELGVPEPITVLDKLTPKVQKNILKTASGFGGCNAAVVFAKDNE